MPQTREHAAIVQLLGIRDGVVALTKRDLVDDDGAELARLGIAELLEDGPLRRRGGRRGVGAHGAWPRRPALGPRPGGRHGRPSRPSDGPARLPVDRSFSLRGIGTVVTGTLWSGSVGTGDRLVDPAGRARGARAKRPGARPAGRAGRGRTAGRAGARGRRAKPGPPRPRRGDSRRLPGVLPARLRRPRARVGAARPAKRRARDGAPRHRRAHARVAIPGGGELAPGCRRPGAASAPKPRRRRRRATAS